MPGRIAYHTACVYKDNVYIFGGNTPKPNNAGDNQEEMFSDKMQYLNLRTMSWSVLRTRGDQVLLRDEHTGVIDPDSGNMVIFGGF